MSRGIYDFYVRMTNRCNLNCVYCYEDANHDKAELSVEQIKEAISIVQPTHCISLTGGEPLLRMDDCIDLAHWITARGNRVRFCTNGTIPIPWETLDDIPPRDLNISLSLDGFRAWTDANRGAGTFDKVMEMLESIQRHGKHLVCIKATLTPDQILNHETELKRFVAWCRALPNSSILIIGDINAVGRGKDCVTAEDVKMKQELVQKIHGLNVGYKYKTVWGNFVHAMVCTNCGYRSGNAILGTDGMIYMLCDLLDFPLCDYSEFTVGKYWREIERMERLHLGYRGGRIQTE